MQREAGHFARKKKWGKIKRGWREIDKALLLFSWSQVKSPIA